MKHIEKSVGLSALALLAVPLHSAQVQPQSADRPNIIVILADDMGYSDLGCYGGEIQTPNLDRLAKQGLRYRQFYNGARSCPTRASLLTGLYAHQAGMGWMAAADMQRPAYQGYLNKECVTLAEVLRESGYGTYMSGKWHVSSDRQNNGQVKDNWPNQRGFDRFYGIVDGASNYFKMTYNDNNERRKSPDDADFYFTHAISDSATVFVHRHDFEKSPLFLYLAYTAPHWPLHALQKDIDRFAEIYKAGWDRLREDRFRQQKAMGLFTSDTQLPPRDKRVPAWDSLTEADQQEYAMRMAIYAAQIYAMDQGIGKLVSELEEKGQLDNTIIMFLSDNGACAEHISSGRRKTVDGKEDTYESYRINWANLSSTPYKEYKHHTNEGGIATPLIVHYPKGIRKELRNTYVDEYGHITDIMATCVDLAKAKYPRNYKGHRITPLQGVSLVPNLSGKRTKRGITFWEHEANIAARDGKWKIVTKVMEGGKFDEDSIKLYDMETDPTEMNDLSLKYPRKKAQLYAAWKRWAEKVDVFPLDTRFYGERQRDYKRNCINGEFQDNFGGWERSSGGGADIRFSIDTVSTISGNKTARIEILKPGNKPATGILKWVFNADKGEKVSISFKAKALHNTNIIVRLENMNNYSVKPIDKVIPLTGEVASVEILSTPLFAKGNHQLAFYVGTSGGTIWIDDVKMEITDD